jgi:hypothetical protein
VVIDASRIAVAPLPLLASSGTVARPISSEDVETVASRQEEWAPS